MNTPNWDEERNKLRARFASGDITKAKRTELEWYLVVLANSSLIDGRAIPPPAYKTETEELENVIRHLLQVRLGEELHRHSTRLAKIAIVVSIFAVGFSGLQWWNGYRANHTTAPAIVPEQSSEHLPQSNLLRPATQSLNAPDLKEPKSLTNSRTGSQTTATNK